MYDLSADALRLSHRALVLFPVSIGTSHSVEHKQASDLATMAGRELGNVYAETTNEAIQANLVMISYPPAIEIHD